MTWHRGKIARVMNEMAQGEKIAGENMESEEELIMPTIMGAMVMVHGQSESLS